jgi:hypothetical protein
LVPEAGLSPGLLVPGALGVAGAAGASPGLLESMPFDSAPLSDFGLHPVNASAVVNVRRIAYFVFMVFVLSSSVLRVSSLHPGNVDSRLPATLRTFALPSFTSLAGSVPQINERRMKVFSVDFGEFAAASDTFQTAGGTVATIFKEVLHIEFLMVTAARLKLPLTRSLGRSRGRKNAFELKLNESV